jgi:Cu-Zn family superoxide dismutase
MTRIIVGAIVGGFAAAWLLIAPGIHADAGNPGGKAVAVLHPTKGNSVSGVVTFTKTGAGVKVVAHIEGLTPGVHAFHIHEFGDCSSPDATSAGAHFNPTGMPHAGPDSEKRHMGDLGNVTADENGVANYERVDMHLAFDGPHSIIGRSVIVHEKADDFTTQPTGGAGGRVACGVIGIAKE